MKHAVVRSGLAVPFVALALVLLAPAIAAAQATMHVQVDVHVEAPPQVVVVQPPPPPAQIVIVEPQPAPPPTIVLIEEHAPPPAPVEHAPVTVAPAPPQAPTRPSIEPVLHARGEMYLSDEYGMAGLGGAAGIGAVLHREWSGAVVVGYLGDLGGSRSEVHLGVEVTKDFDPASVLGFYVVLGMGAAFLSGDRDDEVDGFAGARMMGQLGVGARMNVFDERVAITLDARGVLRYGLPDVDDVEGDRTVAGGAMLTLGLAIRL